MCTFSVIPWMTVPILTLFLVATIGIFLPLYPCGRPELIVAPINSGSRHFAKNRKGSEMQTLTKLRNFAQGAEQTYGATRTIRGGEDWRIFAAASEHLPEAQREELLAIARELHPDREPDSRLAVCFCADEFTIRLLCRYSSTPYWFWQIVRVACENASQLPLTALDIWTAVEQIASSACVPGVGAGTQLRRPLGLCSPEQLTALHDAGVIIQNNDGELEPNPLFV